MGIGSRAVSGGSAARQDPAPPPAAKRRPCSPPSEPAQILGFRASLGGHQSTVRAAVERMIEIVERTCAELPLVLVLENLS